MQGSPIFFQNSRLCRVSSQKNPTIPSRNPIGYILSEKLTISSGFFGDLLSLMVALYSVIKYLKVYSVARQLKLFQDLRNWSQYFILGSYRPPPFFFSFFCGKFEISCAGEDWSLASRFSWSRLLVELFDFWKKF